MANSLVLGKFKLRQMGNNGTPVDLDANTIKLMLVNATEAALADATKQAKEFYADVSANEITGTGYTAGGAVLAGKTSTQSAGVYTFDATDPAWTTATITASGAYVYQDTGVATTSPLIAYLDFGGSVSSTAGTYTVQFNAAGVFTA